METLDDLLKLPHIVLDIRKSRQPWGFWRVDPYAKDIPPQYAIAMGDDGVIEYVLKPEAWLRACPLSQLAKPTKKLFGKAVLVSHESQRFGHLVGETLPKEYRIIRNSVRYHNCDR